MDILSIRAGEVVGVTPVQSDASLVFIGRIRTPFQSREDCPRQGSLEGPDCRVEIAEPWRQAMRGLEKFSRLEILYWMDRARRDLLVQAPRHRPEPAGTFAVRSPLRPNPIATSVVALIAVEDGALIVRGLDCLDGTPLLDIKPCRQDAALI